MVKDIDKLEWKGPPADSITPRVHLAECTGSNYNEHFEKLYLHFVIIDDGTDKGKTTFMAFNVPRNRRIGTSSKYYKTWTRLTGRHPSRKDSRMPSKVLHGQTYKVRIELKYLHNSDGEPEYSEDHEYGLVTEIVEEVKNRVSS